MDKVEWLNYGFTVYEPNTTWNNIGGIYIFCLLNRWKQWDAVYIGQADSFVNRLTSHERWNEAARLGATHVHAMAVPLAATRDRVEAQLIQAFQPPLNTQLK